MYLMAMKGNVGQKCVRFTFVFLFYSIRLLYYVECALDSKQWKQKCTKKKKKRNHYEANGLQVIANDSERGTMVISWPGISLLVFTSLYFGVGNNDGDGEREYLCRKCNEHVSEW